MQTDPSKMQTDPSIIFSEETQDTCVEEMLLILEKDDLPQSSFKVDFKVSKGRMVAPDEEYNTVLSFDTKNDTSLRNILNYICETDNVDENDIKNFEEFRKGLIDKLSQDDSKDKIREILRERIFKNTPKEIIPIETLEIKDIEIADLPVVDYVLVIKKLAPPNYQVASISDDIFKELQNTSESLNEIIERKKKSGDERYRYVDSVEKRKTFFEITIPIYADYSLKEIELNNNDSPTEH